MPFRLLRFLNSRGGRGAERAAGANRDYRRLSFLALDLELSSLDPGSGEILSIGYVPITHGRIAPSRGKHLLISDHGGVGESAEYHGIRDCDRRDGVPLAEAVQQLRSAAAGGTLIFHHAKLDLAFLKRAGFRCEANAVIDTLHLERRRLLRQPFSCDAHQLRLHQCRRRYHLPDRQAHNAFSDALATAELFLAQCAYMAGVGELSLKELLRAGRV